MSKPWYLSKTVWATLITGVLGTYVQLDAALGNTLPDIPGWVFVILGAFGLYGRAKADGPISFSGK